MGVTVLNKIPRFVYFNIYRCQNVRYYSKKKEKEEDMEIPENQLKQYYSANDQVENGFIYDNKPFKFTCEAGKNYSWCLCGKSHKQPFCDGTHKNIHLKIKLKPIRFSVKETKSYWLCNCKQTSNRPFCDGTHNREDIGNKK
ncbi:CDGSH iron-sulfur domain-containing protein 3, mitochondrial [Colletes gigas]|uniref:CDGSH iron-sulfur domain-containing protein 3, mitochondrial n=1 Tax=Colletes gigas TaxID=935657 RepID=UPI001C9B809A|nr:CDGSH iron-sulfur domain-containing protein 3, mitochondrial [Colletes gigas]